MATQKRADQLVNGDIVILEYQSNRFIGIVNAVMQFTNEPGKTNVSLHNQETGKDIQVRVPNRMKFDILEYT